MGIIISATYFLILLGIIAVSSFVIYHIIKYAINKQSSQLMLLIFIPIMLILLIINISLFLNLDLESLFNIF